MLTTLRRRRINRKFCPLAGIVPGNVVLAGAGKRRAILGSQDLGGFQRLRHPGEGLHHPSGHRPLIVIVRVTIRGGRQFFQMQLQIRQRGNFPGDLVF